jgi:BirA family biotin operon repressor/biotin-[acetyl-CoA-carboxylase] ligase
MSNERVIGRRIVYFDSLDSTNSYALTFAQDASQNGLVVLAGAQSAGRGQHGRIWTAPAGSSVLMSVLLFPPPELRRPVVLTAWVAVSVCQLIRQLTGIQAQIKWPNDVLIDGRKVCGILIEQRSAGAGGLATVVGIGLNVTQSAAWFAQAGLTEGTALGLHTHQSLAARDVALDLIAQLDEEYRRLLAGSAVALETSWNNHLGLAGAHVLIECTTESMNVRLLKVSFTGLDVEIAGQRVRVQPEGVRHITPCR